VHPARDAMQHDAVLLRAAVTVWEGCKWLFTCLVCYHGWCLHGAHMPASATTLRSPLPTALLCWACRSMRPLLQQALQADGRCCRCRLLQAAAAGYSPLDGILLCDLVLHAHAVVLLAPASNPVAGPLQHHVEVHTWRRRAHTQAGRRAGGQQPWW
jgi:hypothetical protein